VNRFIIKALGCKVSQYDAQRLADSLLEVGFESTEDEPDLFILNSCSVTGRASQKTRQALHAARRKWPRAKIILAGCEAKLREVVNEIGTDVDAMLKPACESAELKNILRLLGFNFVDAFERRDSVSSDHRPNRTRAFLKIQDGCDHFCSYCIVPHLRGRERSKSFVDALAEARKIVSAGHIEIVVTGIHLGRFAGGVVNFLRELEKIDSLRRIRLSSMEPLEVDDNLLEWMANSPKACNHLHVRLQAGSDLILKAMNRPYDTSHFSRIVDRARKILPDLGLTTDIIVGFPGETDEVFTRSLDYIRSAQFSKIHIFSFSPRKGTPAANFPGQIPNAVKHERSKAVQSIWNASAREFHSRFVGRHFEVLWETSADGYWRGLSREYVACKIHDDGANRKNTFGSFKVVSFDSEEVLVEE